MSKAVQGLLAVHLELTAALRVVNGEVEVLCSGSAGRIHLKRFLLKIIIVVPSEVSSPGPVLLLMLPVSTSVVRGGKH